MQLEGWIATIVAGLTAEKIIGYLSALLTATIAVTTAYIAIQQYWLQLLASRRELFDRRLVVFNATLAFLGQIYRDGSPNDESLRKFNIEIGTAPFLFGSDVAEYLEELHKRAIDLMSAEAHAEIQIKAPQTVSYEDRKKAVDYRRRQFDWFQEQLKIARGKFRPYLQINK